MNKKNLPQLAVTVIDHASGRRYFELVNQRTGNGIGLFLKAAEAYDHARHCFPDVTFTWRANADGGATSEVLSYVTHVSNGGTRK
ncbi:MAG TPA: hypothetical protein VM285_06960 [Polyangia bacterium]|nr:hypothetical protein [Polyangia bacterium]